MTTEYLTDATALSAQARMQGAGLRRINLKRMIRMRGPLMAFVAVMLIIPLSLAVWFFVPREYEATSAIRFSPSRQVILTNTEGTAVSSDYVTYVETQKELIKGNSVLERVVQQPQIRDLPLIARQRDPRSFLQRRVRAQLTPVTELVQVSFSSSDRNAALLIVRTVVEEYLKQATASEKVTNDQITRQLIEERDTLENKVTDLRNSVDKRRRSIGGLVTNSSEGVDAEMRSIFDNLSKAQADISTAENQAGQLESQVGQLEEIVARSKSAPEQPIYEFGIEESLSTDNAVQVKTQQLASTDARLAELKEKYLEGSPFLTAQIEARNSMEKELARSQGEARARIAQSRLELAKLDLERAKKAVDDAKTRSTNFTALLDTHTQKSLEIMQAMASVKEEEAALEDARTDLRDVQEKIRMLHIESRAPSTINVAEPAQAPEFPDYNRRLKMLALVMMASCGAGATVGLWRELTDQQIRTAQDVGYISDLPLIAMIPRTDSDKLPAKVRASSVMLRHPESISANEYRRVLTRIIYPPEGSAELNTVLITSPMRGDGKTSLACNLAAALAQANRRVLLLDICSRRPSIEQAMGLSAGPGLSEILSGSMEAGQAIRTAGHPNLSVLGPGLGESGVIGQLASRDIVGFLEQAEQMFEHVIIDSPPVLLMADAKLLAPVVDGVIVTVGVGVTTLGMAQRCLNDLQQIGTNIVGVVLNGLRYEPGGYMRDNLDNFYNYAAKGRRHEQPEYVVEASEPPRQDYQEVIIEDDDDSASVLIMDEPSTIRPKRRIY
ncbi:MAG: AAA family ATPase [Candidatus Hydrogenedentes bacterium]|nr:AAA family ATPase [Candidatus Hydrogenedentota bacterium]